VGSNPTLSAKKYENTGLMARFSLLCTNRLSD